MEILHTHPDFIVCIKPVGIDSEHDIPTQLRQQCGGEIYTVHRLDKNVGGVMVYARSKAAASAFSRAIQDGSMIKEYRALVHGEPPANGDWEDLLFKDAKKNKVFIVKRMRGGVKKARLTFERLTNGDISEVFIRLYTGRSHQIRVQFAGRGFPLVGDHKYGARDEVAAPQLFSCRLTFPYKNQPYCFEATPPWA